MNSNDFCVDESNSSHSNAPPVIAVSEDNNDSANALKSDKSTEVDEINDDSISDDSSCASDA